MPLELGFHAQVQTQADLHQLLDQAQAERKRAIVVEGPNGRMITVLKKGNALAELLRSWSGQTGREARRLEQFRALLPQGPGLPAQHPQVAQAFVDALQPQQPTAPGPSPDQGPAAAVAQDAAVHTEAPATPQVQELVVQTSEPPVTPGVVSVASGTHAVQGPEQYVERQGGDPICLKHSIAAYYNRPVFSGTDDFIAFRDNVYRGMGPYIEDRDFTFLSTSVYAVTELLETMRQDPAWNNDGIDTQAPWSLPFKIDVRWAGRPKQEEQDAQELDAQFRRFAGESSSQRFIVRTGSGQSGHFWFISHNPSNGQWTAANSTGAKVESGPSPSRLLEQASIRQGELFVWTQVRDDPQAVAARFQEVTLRGEPPQRPAEPQAQQLPAAGPVLATIAEEDPRDDDLPPPIFTAFQPRSRAAFEQAEPSFGHAVAPRTQPKPVQRVDWGTERPIEGVDPEFQRRVTRDLESTAAPQVADALDALNQSLDQARQGHPARYHAMARLLEDDLNQLARFPQQGRALVERAQQRLQALEHCQEQWRRADAGLDVAVMNYLRATNAQVRVEQTNPQDREHREAVASLSRASRQMVSIWHQAAQTGQALPADWTEGQQRGAEEAFRSAQRLGIADVAAMPVWFDSPEERQHAGFVSEAKAYLQRWS